MCPPPHCTFITRPQTGDAKFLLSKSPASSAPRTAPRPQCSLRTFPRFAGICGGPHRLPINWRVRTIQDFVKWITFLPAWLLLDLKPGNVPRSARNKKYSITADVPAGNILLLLSASIKSHTEKDSFFISKPHFRAEEEPRQAIYIILWKSFHAGRPKRRTNSVQSVGHSVGWEQIR